MNEQERTIDVSEVRKQNDPSQVQLSIEEQKMNFVLSRAPFYIELVKLKMDIDTKVEGTKDSVWYSKLSSDLKTLIDRYFNRFKQVEGSILDQLSEISIVKTTSNNLVK